MLIVFGGFAFMGGSIGAALGWHHGWTVMACSAVLFGSLGALAAGLYVYWRETQRHG